MTPQEQIEVITATCTAIQESLIRDVRAGRLPSAWDSIEIRWLLVDRFQNAAYKAGPARRKAYRNTVITQNL